MDIDNKT